MGNPNASDQELWEALDAANLSGFLRTQEGLDTKLEEEGNNLSGGQCQRLAFARAWLHDSSVYVFDEATSNIDVESEAVLLDSIYRLAQDHAVVLISHRLANVVDAQNIYVLDKGYLIESGTHQELFDIHGVYARLWKTQQRLEAYGRGEICEET
jgi:ABC-type multidrug transport system fused ATPase/permease subunit